MEKKLINIGCGSSYNPAWLNFDILPIDGNVNFINIKKPLAFKNSSVDAIYSSHTLEHVNKQQAENFIKECFRVLKPGGIIRLAVPDLERICRAYLENLDDAYFNKNKQALINYQWNKVELFDQMVRQQKGGELFKIILSKPINKEYIESRIGAQIYSDDIKERLLQRLKYLLSLLFKFNLLKFWSVLIGTIKSRFIYFSGERHFWGYDKLDLKVLLESAGFSNFSIKTFSESNIFNWSIYCLDANETNSGPRKPDSIFVEAIK